MKTKLLILVLAVAVMAAGFWAGVVAGKDRSYTTDWTYLAPVQERTGPMYSSGQYDQAFYDRAYDNAPTYSMNGARSIVVPHHLLESAKIAGVFNAIASNKIDTIILLSPNHFSVGRSSVQTTIGTWKTPYGDLETDDDVVRDLLKADNTLKLEERTFEGEHGISALTPFIKRSFPNAKLVPVVIDESIHSEYARDVGRSIDALSNPRTLVIASIDMSHYLPEYVASYHDAATELALARGRYERGRFVGMSTLEVDASAVLHALWGYNEAGEVQAWHKIDRDSSVSLGATSNWRENTSHILGYYTAGSPDETPYLTVHFVGDIMLDRGVRKLIDANDVAYPWKEMSRFLNGSHLVVGNLEGTVNDQSSTYTYDPPFRFVFDPKAVTEMGKHVDIVSLANNHSSDVGSKGEIETQRQLGELDIYWFGSYRSPDTSFNLSHNNFNVAFIGYHAFQPNEDSLKEEIEQAKALGNFVIVMPHWGTEYQFTPDGQEQRLAKLMSDAGADLIIGGHPHVPQTVEESEGSKESEGSGAKVVPVVYSLGNFVFDQQIPETWTALTVGAIIQDQSIDLYLMPVYTKNGQPTPISDFDAQSFFQTHGLQSHYHFDL